MTIPKKIYVTLSQFCDDTDSPRRLLQDAGFLVTENKTGKRMKKEELLDVLHDTDAVLAGVEPYDADLLSQLPSLKLISRVGVGTDSIDLEAAKKLNIQVAVTADEIIEPVAQMTLGMMLALIRNFPLHQNNFQKGVWKKHAGLLMSELTIGLIGLGKIGRQVLEYIRPFGCRVLVADPFVDPKMLPAKISLISLDHLLQEADLVSLHLSRSPKEGYLLGKKELGQMKKGSYLVNTARGYFVDEKALEETLQSGHLAGAAIDVFETEPCVSSFTKLSNVLCTPHVSTLARGSRIAMEVKCAQNVVAFFNRHPQ